jgi:hypothetical protein
MLCSCVIYHTPEPKSFARHHILPKSWGGSDDPSNIIVLCPTTHENVHKLLNVYVKYKTKPGCDVLRHYNGFVRELAQRAWDQRGVYTPYTIGPEDSVY